MACEFEVFLLPLCSGTLEVEVSLVTKRPDGTTQTKRVGICFVTELTTKLHYDDVLCETQTGERSFGIIYNGKFRGNDVVVKKMKEVDGSEESMEEFENEVTMLDKFRYDQIVHFYGACTIPNHVMMVTEFAPCGSLMDCIRKERAV